MFLSFVFYWSIFYRLWYKRRDFILWKKVTNYGAKNSRPTVQQKETHARLQFGYHLLTICSICWTCLVVSYFVVMAGKRCLPEGHFLHNDSTAMVADTLFDLTAKFFYCKVIIEVHGQIFDPQARTRRQLDELRRIMNDLWETSKDVICILAIRTDSTNGITGNTTATTMLSPAFAEKVVGTDDHSGQDKMPETSVKDSADALMVEGSVDRVSGRLSNCTVVKVPASNIPYPFAEVNDGVIDSSELLHKEAVSIVSAICQLEYDGRRGDELVVHDIQTIDDNSVRRCELQLNSAPDTQAIIAIARDVTERYKRHEAERRAHEETMARQQDAHNVNRFTRHEIKNGLLAGIEMCDAMRSTMLENPFAFKRKGNPGENPSEAHGPDSDTVESPSTCLARHLMDLEGTLHEILGTVLAEATARDVIHEAYKPQLEALDIRDELYKSIGSAAAPTRFPVTVSPADMPKLKMDPQLLRYIHRNAISNAVKYGKRDGIIRTEVRYSSITRVFELDVINQPGRKHADLVAMGPAASRAVFRSRTRLHNSINDDNSEGENELGNIGRLSSGDGAWIMEKCAKTLGYVRQSDHPFVHDEEETCLFIKCSRLFSPLLLLIFQWVLPDPIRAISDNFLFPLPT
jgi:signal transduction histidine kinase